nr:hypothetical protein [Pseudomonas palmensis]
MPRILTENGSSLATLRLVALVTAVVFGLPARADLTTTTTTSAEQPGTGPVALGVVPAKATCADLAGVDLTAIGGAGSTITAAIETTTQAGIAVCAVEGTLAPAINFAMQLPTAS